KRVRVPREQMQWLKEIYDINPYPSQEELESISSDIGLSVRKVRVWFQNRRTRQRARNGTSEAKVE
ncbi:Homeodomain-like protein, partial [Chytriomyces sp. MP71]